MSHEHKTSDMKSHAKGSCARWLWRLVRRLIGWTTCGGAGTAAAEAVGMSWSHSPAWLALIVAATTYAWVTLELSRGHLFSTWCYDSPNSKDEPRP